jgi:hypothetical protein
LHALYRPGFQVWTWNINLFVFLPGSINFIRGSFVYGLIGSVSREWHIIVDVKDCCVFSDGKEAEKSDVPLRSVLEIAYWMLVGFVTSVRDGDLPK